MVLSALVSTRHTRLDECKLLLTLRLGTFLGTVFGASATRLRLGIVLDGVFGASPTRLRLGISLDSVVGASVTSVSSSF
jgi:hypothetical protein